MDAVPDTSLDMVTTADATSDTAMDAALCTEGSCGSGEVCCATGCTDPLSDPDHCGGCGVECPQGINAPTRICTAGACSLECLEGFGNCDGNLSNGCETALDVTLNCGACGNTCGPGQACVDGVCECTQGSCMCQAGEAFCDGTCVNTASSDAHCGGCGIACGANESCVSGACVCESGFTECGGGCVANAELCTPSATDTDSRTGCGACGTGMETRQRTCTSTCTWGAWSSWGACVDNDCCGNGVCEASETCANCVDCQAGHLGNGDQGDPCPGVPAEQWRCVFDPSIGFQVSQVCRNGSWLNWNLNPSSCAACVCGYSGACDQ